MIEISKTNTRNFDIKKNGYVIFKGKLDGYFIFYNKSNSIITLFDNISAVKFDIPFKETNYSNVNEAMIEIANSIFLDYDLAADLTIIPKNVFSINNYALLKDNYNIIIISKKNIFDVKQMNSKFNSDVIIRLTTDYNFKYDYKVIRQDLNRIEIEFDDLYSTPVTTGGTVTGTFKFGHVDGITVLDGATGVVTEVSGIYVTGASNARIETIGTEKWGVMNDPYQSPSFSSFNMSGQPTIIESGDFIAGSNRTFTWSTSNSANVQSNSVQISDVTGNPTPNTVLGSSLTNDGNENININSNIVLSAGQTHTWRISATNTNTSSFSRTFSVEARWAVYSGNNALTTMDETSIEALSTKALKTGFNGTYSLPAGGYKWICYPTTYGTASTFTDTVTGFPVAMIPFELITVVNIFGQTVDYKCHRTLNILGSSININVS